MMSEIGRPDSWYERPDEKEKTTKERYIVDIIYGVEVEAINEEEALNIAREEFDADESYEIDYKVYKWTQKKRALKALFLHISIKMFSFNNLFLSWNTLDILTLIPLWFGDNLIF